MPIEMDANEEEKQEKQPQDFSTPFSPPNGVRDSLPPDHPQTDLRENEQAHYDAGRDDATGVSDPGPRGVLGYDPHEESDAEWPAN